MNTISPAGQIILLDLEQTLIDDWSTKNAMPENIEAIRLFLAQNSYAKVGVLSFAVWNNKDVSEFQTQLQDALEQALNCSISVDWILTKGDMRRLLRAHSKWKALNVEDFDDFFMEKDHLLHYLASRGAWPNTKVILIDDVVPDTQLSVTRHKTTVATINIKSLKDYQKNMECNLCLS